MDSLLVVEEHALTEDAYVRLVELLELFKFGPFVFQRSEEPFDHRVIVTAPSSSTAILVNIFILMNAKYFFSLTQ